MTQDEYEAVRETGICFVVAPSDEHVWPDLERIRDRTERFWIVEKTGEAAAFARLVNPRAPLPLRT